MDFQEFTKQNDFSLTQHTPSVIQPAFKGCQLWTRALHDPESTKALTLIE